MKQSLSRRMQAQQQQQRVAWYGASRRRAEELIRTGNYSEAEQLLLRLRSIRPDDQQVRRLLSIARAHLGQPVPWTGPVGPTASSRGPSPMKVATFMVSLLGLLITALQVGHDVFGLRFSPIEAAQNVIEPVLQGGNDRPPSDNDTIPDVDTSSPTTPQNLRLVAQNGCTASLAWDPSQDDVGVRSYRLYEDGHVAGLTDGTITAFDVQLFPGDDHRFTVQASDGPNDSGQSNEVSVPACSIGDGP